MTNRNKAIAYLKKQRELEVQMMNGIKEYMPSNDRRYNKLRRNYAEVIEIIDYILLRL